jgi:hypothetical protein
MHNSGLLSLILGRGGVHCQIFEQYLDWIGIIVMMIWLGFPASSKSL